MFRRLAVPLLYRVSPIILLLPSIIGPSLWPLCLSGFAPPVAASLFLFLRSVFPVLLLLCHRGVLQVVSFARHLFGCFLPSVLLRWFSRFVSPSRFFPIALPRKFCLPFGQVPVAHYVSPILHFRFSLSCICSSNAAPSSLLGCVAQLLSFPSRFPVIFGRLGPPVFAASCICCIC